MNSIPDPKMNIPTPAELRGLYRDAERRLRDAHPDGVPQAGQEWIIRTRRIAELPDSELQDFIDEGADIPEDAALAALTEFGKIFSNPMLRLVESLPADPASACRAIIGAKSTRACRHILAGAALSAILPCTMCIAHPEQARCPSCHDQHVISDHDEREELVCDWCGTQCLHQIFPVVIPLGSITAVRNLADKRSYVVGPAGITGLGACYSCRRDMIRHSKTIADVFAALESP